MRIAVVSDTHGHAGYTNAAINSIRQQSVEAVIHCGDIGSLGIVSLFSPWPTHFVFGNVDHDDESLTSAIRAAGQTCHGRFGSVSLEGIRIAFLHSDDQLLFERTINSGEYDLVCYGHTHVPEQHLVGTTIVLNPGALYRASPHTYAVVDLPDLQIRHIPVA
jgi:putative phosphoesterase